MVCRTHLEIREKCLESERAEFQSKHDELEKRLGNLSVKMKENENRYQMQITNLEKEKQMLSEQYEQAIVLKTMNN
ncbi:hypothetical protein BDY19DRAFT_609136 [Irpex rosettiformis]|uniref:Uncharacterized protein n=1 Tax=Irpex rosettiformis TaxID=378272 RepID=A0ACB8TPK4_9APHY|nr:hypothetical protein BDY19DRAFT_609136 [Irpex rosettiformis]